MHELSIAAGIVDAVVVETGARGLGAVHAVYIRLGPLSGVDPDALLFSFPIACEGTPLAGARLQIEPVPVTIACASCGVESQPPSLQRMQCPHCGGLDTRVIQGRELELRAFEAVDKEEVQT